MMWREGILDGGAVPPRSTKSILPLPFGLVERTKQNAFEGPDIDSTG